MLIWRDEAPQRRSYRGNDWNRRIHGLTCSDEQMAAVSAKYADEVNGILAQAEAAMQIEVNRAAETASTWMHITPIDQGKLEIPKHGKPIQTRDTAERGY